MKLITSAVLMAAMLGTGAAHAQTQLDHQVQKMWDNLFNPGPPGDPRTNWERERDQRYGYERYGYERRREAERAEWCRYNPRAEGCYGGYGYSGQYQDRGYGGGYGGYGGYPGGGYYGGYYNR